MSDDQGADPQQEVTPENFADQIRRKAAGWGRQAEAQAELTETFRELSAKFGGTPIEPPPGADLMARRSEAAAYRLRTMQRLMGEWARDYEAMQAEGGPDNPEAYARYAEGCRMRAELMPKDYMNPDLDAPDSTQE